MIKNTINGKTYVGQSVDINKRLKEHLHAAFANDEKRYNKYLYRDIRKQGPENFVCSIIEMFNINDDNKLSKVLNNAEAKYIIKYKTYVKDNPKTGYNLTLDGCTRKYMFTSKQKKLLFTENKNGKTIYEISKELNISEPTISKAIDSIRKVPKSKKNEFRDKDIQKRYLDGMSINDIQKMTGYSHSVVQKALKRTCTASRKTKSEKEYKCKKIGKNLLLQIEKDFRDGCSLRGLAKKYKISRNTISINLKELGYTIINTGNKSSKRAILEINSKTNEVISEYDSIVNACKAKGLKSTSSIVDVASKKYDRNKTAAGSKWIYVNTEKPYVFSNCYQANTL